MNLLSTEEAASYLRLTTKRVQALARSRRLPGRRVGRRWLFDRRDLDACSAPSRPNRPAGSTSAPEPAPRTRARRDS
jgi:excisionase family DNA binding protein